MFCFLLVFNVYILICFLFFVSNVRNFFANKAILGKKKWISQYINLRKKIYEIEIVTTMKMIEVACETYKSN
jgi:hypothetical protein